MKFRKKNLMSAPTFQHREFVLKPTTVEISRKKNFKNVQKMIKSPQKYSPSINKTVTSSVIDLWRHKQTWRHYGKNSGFHGFFNAMRSPSLSNTGKYNAHTHTYTQKNFNNDWDTIKSPQVRINYVITSWFFTLHSIYKSWGNKPLDESLQFNCLTFDWRLITLETSCIHDWLSCYGNKTPAQKTKSKA